MKKALLITVSLFCVGKLWGQQGLGSQPTYPVKIWQASVTATADTNVQFSSGGVVIHAVVCGSCSVNNAGADSIQFYSSTSPTFGSWTTTMTPRIALSAYTFRPQRDVVFDVHGSSHVFYDKKGTSEIGILWDWFNSSNMNPRRIINNMPK